MMLIYNIEESNKFKFHDINSLKGVILLLYKKTLIDNKLDFRKNMLLQLKYFSCVKIEIWFTNIQSAFQFYRLINANYYEQH